MECIETEWIVTSVAPAWVGGLGWPWRHQIRSPVLDHHQKASCPSWPPAGPMQPGKGALIQARAQHRSERCPAADVVNPPRARSVAVSAGAVRRPAVETRRGDVALGRHARHAVTVKMGFLQKHHKKYMTPTLDRALQGPSIRGNPASHTKFGQQTVEPSTASKALDPTLLPTMLGRRQYVAPTSCQPATQDRR